MPRASTYDNESISSLKGPDRVRLRPGVIFGSDGIEGCEHSFFEILANSIDEAREGFGDKIYVRRFADGSMEIRDSGRGIPLDYNPKEKRYNWELVYCELYAGGKYNTLLAENYEFSLGLNGLGACATQYASEYFDVEVIRDGYKYSMSFKEGHPVGKLRKEETTVKRTGTVQKWKPDRKVFTDTDISTDYFRRILKQQAVVNNGVRFIFQDDIEDIKEEFYYPEGILGYVKELSRDKEFTLPHLMEGEGRGKDRADKPEYKLKFSMVFAFNNEINSLEYFHNSSFLEYGGSPERAVRSAFVSEIDKYLRQNNKYRANESKITFNDIADSLIFVSSSFSTQTSYENQTKKSISNRFIQRFMTDFLRQNLEIYFIENKTEAEKIAEQILTNKRSREVAERQRVNLKKKLMGKMDLSGKVKKFVDCRSRDVEERELYIVEGDSALGSIKQGRDATFQAIIPVRGKILNCLKSNYETIFKNEIITDLLKVFGCGVEIHTKHNKDLSAFDLSNLRWNKIIICTDADEDGFQIRTLILAMIYRLVPTLLDEEKIYIAESPLYELTVTGKGSGKGEQTFFAYNEREKNRLVADNPGSKIHIQRSKGLGENEPDMMWETTMNPESRRLIKILPDDPVKAAEMFEILLGDDVNVRRDFIADNGHLYLDHLDVD